MKHVKKQGVCCFRVANPSRLREVLAIQNFDDELNTNNIL